MFIVNRLALKANGDILHINTLYDKNATNATQALGLALRHCAHGFNPMKLRGLRKYARVLCTYKGKAYVIFEVLKNGIYDRNGNLVLNIERFNIGEFSLKITYKSVYTDRIFKESTYTTKYGINGVYVLNTAFNKAARTVWYEKESIMLDSCGNMVLKFTTQGVYNELNECILDFREISIFKLEKTLID